MAKTSTTGVPAVPEDVLNAFRARREVIINAATRRAMQFAEEVEQHGEKAEELIQSGLTFTVKAIEAAMQTGNTGILDFQIPWGMDRLQHDQVQPGQVLHRFKIIKQVVTDMFDTQIAQHINPYIDHLIAQQEEGMQK